MRDLLWGDNRGVTSGIATLVKVLVALGIAWALHELVLVRSLTSHVQTNQELLEQSFSKATSILNSNGFAYRICPYITGSVPSRAACRTSKQLDKNDSFEFGYSISPTTLAHPNSVDGYFFQVEKVDGMPISHPVLRDSIDVMMRKIERLAFDSVAAVDSTNSTATTDIPSTDVKLCFGSSEPLQSAVCNLTDQIRAVMAPVENPSGSLADLLESLRMQTLILGPVQLLTLAVFIYTVIEIIGLYSRWVAPRDITFSVHYSDGVAELETPTDVDKRIVKSRKRLVRGIGDRLFTRVLHAAADPKATAASIVGTMESSRTYLSEDAVSRQARLEMHGDTLLKIAFMGTVYGIGTALYAARQLDASDPIIRLVAKSDMYAGIGLGFGATLVGILLSIAAAKLRSSLAESWDERINTSYRLIADWGLEKVGNLLTSLPLETRKTLAGMPALARPHRLDRFLIGVGRLTVLAAALVLLLYLAFVYFR